MAGLAFLKRFFEPDPRKEAAASLYRELNDVARSPALYEAGGVPDTLDGRFDMAVLHLFLGLRRLSGAGPEAKEFSQDVFDAAFADFDDALRDLGVGDMSIGKKIKKMAEAFYGRTQAYEQALKAQDPAKALEEALQRNVFRGRPAERGHLAFLANHMMAFADRLDAISTERLFEGRL